MICALLIAMSISGQFRNTYSDSFSDDHISLVKKHDSWGYVQASTSALASRDIHLMKFDQVGNVMLDVTFGSVTIDEYALDVCLGNNNTYLVCGYENIGGLDLGFVMSVDSSFNFLNKVYIQVAANNKHTPALKIINSAYYEQNNPGNYWPGDPSQGYLVVGFEAVGYGATQSKSAYAIKLTNALTIQWARKFDSPIGAGVNDWDMCSNANWMWIGAFGYLIGGSGTSPSGEQAGMATMLNLNGTVLWSQLYSDNNVAGSWCVASDGAYDDAEFELYQLVNFSQTQGGGIIAFNQFTGAINMSRTRYFVSPINDYYAYEFGSSCASQDIFISGYGHNQISGTTQGIFPYVLLYNKNTPQVSTFGPHYSYPTQSINYNPTGSIFSTFSTTEQPRIYYPKHWASRTVNVWSVAGFEDQGLDDECNLIHPYFDGKDSCAFIDPQIQAVPMNIFTHPLNNVSTTYNLPSAASVPTPQTASVFSCCPVTAIFTYSVGTSCNYTFVASGAPGFCSNFTIRDISNNIIATSATTTFNYTFTLNGTYTVCFADCAGSAAAFCRKETCQTIVVNCVTPCGTMDADFTFTIIGCTVNVSDLTPEGNPFGCESWTFGMIASVLAGDFTTFTFPSSGTYTICHTDCCMDGSGMVYYNTVCKTVTVVCNPPCCLPTNWTMTGFNCCRTFTPFFASGSCPGVQYFWSFGDGNTSWNQNPTHCYLGSGMYQVTLTAWCSKMNMITITMTIIVKCALPPPPPCCTGTSKIAYSNNGLLLNTQDASTFTSDVTPCCHVWSWGDGTSSSSVDGSHYYTTPGTYEVAHTVTFNSSSGSSMSHTATQSITVNLTPPCMCAPDHVIAFAGAPVLCSSTGNSTSLHVVDYEGESNMAYQWMHATVSGGPYAVLDGAAGLQTWIDDLSGPSYFVCRCTCLTTGSSYVSDEVSITDAHFDASSTITQSNICVGGSSTIAISAAGASAFVWQPNVTTSSSVTVSPTITTEYSVLVLNPAGCGALIERTVVVDNCVVPINDSPAAATSVSYSSNMNYPNCYPILGDNTYSSDSPESSVFAGTDTWYKIVAQSSAVSITLNSTTSDDVIELYQKIGSNYILMAGGAENVASGSADFERLNYQGLVLGNTYFVSVGSVSGTGGPYSLCIQYLLPSGCAYTTPASGFSLCGNYKSIYRGSASSGVTYDFNFTGVGGGAPPVTTSVTGTNGLIGLSHAALALRYGGVYNARVDVRYTLQDGAGLNEVVLVAGSISSTNCSGVAIATQPSIVVRANQRCPASLLRSHYLIGSPTAGNSNACGAINYTFEFLQVTSCVDNTPIAVLPIEFNTPFSSPYLLLGVLPNLSNQGAWRVRIRPNFSYGQGVYGPAHTIRVSGTSASVLLPDEQFEMEGERISIVNPMTTIYPNPNPGTFLNVSLVDIPQGDMLVQVCDQTGREVYTNRYTTEGKLQTTMVFSEVLSSGLYIIRFMVNDVLITEKFIVQKN